jgi:hypothetical protein
MSQLSRSSLAFVGATVAASLVLSACRSMDPTEPTQSVIVVAVSAFETMGHVQPMVAQSMAADIAAALDADTNIEASPPGRGSSASRDYVLNGTVYAEGERAFVALQLVDTKTAQRVWSENYDYRGIGAESMAADIRKHLQTYASND